MSTILTVKKMAVVKHNLITQGLSGTLGGTIVFRQVGNRTIVSTPPGEQTDPPSAAQLAHRQRFQEAALYAKGQLQDPALKEEYRLAGEHRSKPTPAFAIAVADFMEAPDIHEIDLSDYHGDPGDTIRVRVTDNFRVDEVRIRITGADGTAVENGQAVQQQNAIDWVYTATAANASLTGDKIIVQALDLPGNLTEQERIVEAN